MQLENARIAIVGLGYVGLPLAVEFGKKFDTLGFDISTQRIAELQSGQDRTLEITAIELALASRLRFTLDASALANCNVYIVTVPTPVDTDKRPDLSPLIKASQTVGMAIKPGAVVIYESTVYPGATEEVCVPELERSSGLKFNTDFTVGYSPERVNPGDKQRRLTNIPKVTSGSTPAAADFVDALYNTQRDVNIALMNEFALIFHRLGIDTQEVLAAAETKWNFLPFRPGLVGGHCIGVDPYYLIQKAQSVGYYPDILLACRRINDAMGRHVAAEVVKLMIQKGHAVSKARVLVLGFTFKENCRDIRNTRVIDLVRELQAFNIQVDLYDPHADNAEAQNEYGVSLLNDLPAPGQFDALIVAVAHDEFKKFGITGLRGLSNGRAIIYDIKGLFAQDDVDGRL